MLFVPKLIHIICRNKISYFSFFIELLFNYMKCEYFAHYDCTILSYGVRVRDEVGNFNNKKIGAEARVGYIIFEVHSPTF